MSSIYKAPRPLREIEQEYGQLVQRAGQIQYQIDTQQRDLKALNDTLRDLNQEAYAVKQAEAKAEAEAKAASELPNLTSDSPKESN